MDPFYEHCKRQATGGGLKGNDIGDVYRTVLYQRGFGMTHAFNLRRTHGLGFADGLLSLFRSAVPVLGPAFKSGMKYLGNQAVTTAANIAKDAINGDNVIQAANRRISEAASHAAQDIFARPAPQSVNRRGTKRRAVSQVSAGRLVTSARNSKKVKRGGGGSLVSEYPALAKLI